MGTIANIEVHQRVEGLESSLPRKSLLAVSVVNTSPRHNHCNTDDGILNGEWAREAKANALDGVRIVSIPSDKIIDLDTRLGANC